MRSRDIAMQGLTAILLLSCSSSQHATRVSLSAPTATPAVANTDELSGVVTRFYRDINIGTEAAIHDIALITSPHFLVARSGRWNRDYGYIKKPKVSIDSTKGSSVTYTLDYDYLGNKDFKLTWERHGTWSFVHGSGKWLMDADSWDSIHIVSVTFSGKTYPVTDKVYSDGRHEFDVLGVTVGFLATESSWKTSVVATPTPSSATESNQNFPSTSAADNGPSHYKDSNTEAGPAQVPASSADCEEVGVQGVYRDGEVLETDDGRYLRVADYDTATSSVWVAPFDAMICDGDKVTNKDDDESVDLQP